MTPDRPIAENQLVRGPGPTMWYVDQIKPGAKADFARLFRLIKNEDGIQEAELVSFPDLKSETGDWTPVTDRRDDPVLVVGTGIEL